MADVTLYFVDGDSIVPEQVQAQEPGEWPGQDAKGRSIYINSHFATEAGAWHWLREDSKAGISLAARRVKEAEARLAEAREDAAAACVRSFDREQAETKASMEALLSPSLASRPEPR